MRSVVFDDTVGQIRIGRRPGLELSLPYSPLSGVHARLLKTGDPKHDQWVLEDLGSTNGTYVEDVRLPPGIKRPLTTGTQFRLAEVKLIFDGDVRGLEPTELRNGLDPKAPELKAPEPGRRPSEPKIAVPKIADPRGADSKGVKSKEAVPIVADPRDAESKGVTAKEAVPRVVEAPGAESRGVTSKEAVPRVADPRGAGSSSAPKSGSASKSNSAPKRAEPTETFVRNTDNSGPIPGAMVVPYLTAVAGVDSGPTTFRLEQRDHTYMFGRTRRCEFRVNTSEVSREHASFTRRADGIYVNDLGSVNGVLVNNTRVSEFKLFDGDLIQIGHVKLRLFEPGEDRPRREVEKSATGTPSHGAPGRGTPSRSQRAHHDDPPPPRVERSTSFSSPSAGSDLHPLIAGALEQEVGGHQRRPSVRVRLIQTWEGSSRFRYVIVVVAASVLAICAVIIGFHLAG